MPLRKKRNTDLRLAVDDGWWDLSVRLFAASEPDRHGLYGGHASFYEFVQAETDCQLRKAQTLVRIQRHFAPMPAAVRRWVRSLGWTRARDLVAVVTRENAAEWQAKIQGKSAKAVAALAREAT